METYPMICAEGLRKRYRVGKTEVQALSGIDLQVQQGTVHAILGPNGAGKTTTMKALTTLILPDSGSIHIGGVDVLAEPRTARHLIGVSGQYAAVDENLSATENLEMIGRLYHLGRKAAKQRARDLIDRFDLNDARSRPVKGISGGMRRRLDLAGALVAQPPVLFLDEPTTGLDPRSRQGLWDVIDELIKSGVTLLLTTQYLEEADRLADRISVVDMGRVIAEGTADELKARTGGHRIEFTIEDVGQLEVAAALVNRHAAGDALIDPERRAISAPTNDGPLTLERTLADFGAHNVDLHDAGMRRPTLDDVFLRLTGHAATDDDGDPDDTVTKDKQRKQDKQKETAR